MNRKKQWKSKIVGHDRVPPESLTKHPLNFRRHPQRQHEALATAIREVGFIRSVTVNRTTGNLIDGHERLEQAIQNGEPLIDVEYVELTEVEEAKALATLDRIGEMAEIDGPQLDELLRQIKTGDEVLQGLLAELATDAGITPPDFQPVKIEEQKRLDQKAPITCPECGAEFVPK